MANPRAAIPPHSSMRAPKKGKVGLIVLLTLIALILIFIIMVAFNAFGLRDNMLFPLLRNIPVIGSLVPDGTAAANEGDIAATVADLEAETYMLAAENASLEAQLEILTGMIEQVERENARLAEFEAVHQQFLTDRETFYRNLAMENPDAFLNFFETMHPALAEEMFASLASEQIDEERWRNYLASWSNMNPVHVARVIESMLTTDMRLIVDVMLELPEPFRGSILNALSADSAAAVLRQMEP